MLSERLAGAGVRNLVCVATEYGELLVKAGPLVRVHWGGEWGWRRFEGL